MMNFHEAINYVLPLAAAFFFAALGKVLLSKTTSDAVTALAAKAAAETEHYIGLADQSHNVLLDTAVHAAMSYAENHKDLVTKQFGSKAAYVISTIQSNPKFNKLNIPLVTIEQLVEQLYTEYFADLAAQPAPAAVVAPV